MSQASETLESLGATVAELSRCIAGQLGALGASEISFAPGSPDSFPSDPELRLYRMKLLDALRKLQYLAAGPNEHMFEMCYAHNHESTTIDVLNHFNFWDAVSLDASASYAEIATRVSLPEATVRRFLHVAFSMYYFAPDGPDLVKHTSASALLVKSTLQRSFIEHCLVEVRPAAVCMVEALMKWSVGKTEGPGGMETCPFVLANGVDIWRYGVESEVRGGRKGRRAEVFAEAMKAISKMAVTNYEAVLRQIDWQNIGDGTLIDLGGSTGHFAVAIAKLAPKLKIIVQDLPEVEASFNCNEELEGFRDRITFSSHDFLQPEPLSADAYFMKSIFHDWPDKYVIRILRNLVPVFKTGTRLLIYDGIVPPLFNSNGNEVLSPCARRLISFADMQVFTALNSRERSAEDWGALLKEADERFHVKAIYDSPGTPLGIIEVVFQS
ncbi:S-adenosyl-L-methionine-dependent methyltransferase [Thozetella sp. PMI_491]|nr:S-adenosyl-L-methionine-dependent methyltransferase [Thozetella sp. PMI_491]